MTARATVSPPKPESNIPIGRSTVGRLAGIAADPRLGRAGWRPRSARMVAAVTTTVSSCGPRPDRSALSAAVFYFAPSTVAVGKEHGLDGFRFYFLGRGGVLGDVESQVVASAFGYFEPGLGDKMWDVGQREDGRSRRPPGCTSDAATSWPARSCADDRRPGRARRGGGDDQRRHRAGRAGSVRRHRRRARARRRCRPGPCTSSPCSARPAAAPISWRSWPPGCRLEPPTSSSGPRTRRSSDGEQLEVTDDDRASWSGPRR